MKKFLFVTTLFATFAIANAQIETRAVRYNVKSLVENVTQSLPSAKAFTYYNVDSTNASILYGSTHDTTYLTLPAGNEGATYVIANSTGYAVYVSPDGSEKINASTTPSQIAVQTTKRYTYLNNWVGWIVGY